MDADACRGRGVEAYTERDVTRFASANPSLHVAAHEAAHQLQHMGATCDAGLGAEGHANAVADAATRGASAQDLIGNAGSNVMGLIHNYTVFKSGEPSSWNLKRDIRVADDGRMIVFENEMHRCYADANLIKNANAVLEAKQSGIALSGDSATISGDAPNGSGRKSLKKVQVDIHSAKGGKKDFYTDCGRASREVQGVRGDDTTAHGVYRDGAGRQAKTKKSDDPQLFRDEIYVKSGLGSTPSSARAAYLALSTGERDAFDKKHRINRYAVPRVGESFVARRDDQLSSDGFNWHWAGVIMVSGHDRVTFENFAKEGTKYNSRDKSWFFQMYGPPTKPGQTFHEQQQGQVGAHNTNMTSMTARTSADPSSHVGKAGKTPTAELIDRYWAAPEGEQMAIGAELRRRSAIVTITANNAAAGPSNRVYVEFRNVQRWVRSKPKGVEKGRSRTFTIPISDLVPIMGGTIFARVCYNDWPRKDQQITQLEWSRPFAPASYFGKYNVKVRFPW